MFAARLRSHGNSVQTRLKFTHWRDRLLAMWIDKQHHQRQNTGLILCILDTSVCVLGMSAMQAAVLSPILTVNGAVQPPLTSLIHQVQSLHTSLL